jgi:hypothetical protein
MPTNEHNVEVEYETPEGVKHLYAVDAIFNENHLRVRHYPDCNDDPFLHEDRVACQYPKDLRIPLHRVVEVRDVEL